MKFDFSNENFEKARIHYREASRKHSRARKLFDLQDYAGCVESSQHAIEFYIKTLFVQSGNEIPHTHDPGHKIGSFLDEMKKFNPNIFKDAVIDPLTRIKYISHLVEDLHSIAMYGFDGTPPSMLFLEKDAIYYYSLAQEIMFSIMLIAFQFGFRFENIPQEGRDFLKATGQEFWVEKTERQHEQLGKCLSNFIGKWITPPRNIEFNVNAQKYKLLKKNNGENYLEIQFESGTKLRVHYWRFNHVIERLIKSGNQYIPVGTKIDQTDNTTIQGSLRHEAIEKGHGYANLRIASYVCDMIVLCGYAEYGYTSNQKTDRKVQGVRKTDKLRT